MKLQGIIFDLDGTLADTMQVCLQAFQETLRHFNAPPIDLQELYTLFGPNEEGILRQLLPEHGQVAYSYFLACYERFHRSCTQPFPGIDSLLDQLRSFGLRIAIATGKSAETAEISMRILRLAPRIQRVETGFIDRGDKPGLIRRVLDDWAFPSGQAAYVGDMPSDLYAAERAGVLPIGAAWASSSILKHGTLQQGWLLFTEVEQLAYWIARRNGDL